MRRVRLSIEFTMRFGLARQEDRLLLSGRTMRFSVCTTSVALAAASLISISCEKHHVGELPEVQKEKVDLASGHEADSSGAHAATPEAKPTPAEFFPEKKSP